MQIRFYKYQGAGNDFLILDNRKGDFRESDGVLYAPDGSSAAISSICDRYYGVGADGLMLLEYSEIPGCSFKMVYFNSDGSGGMMCGNGGRCIVAFAADCGIEEFTFEAADGLHLSEIISVENKSKVVRLKMKDVETMTSDYFLDTGTRHLVVFKENLDGMDVAGEAHPLRYSPIYAPIGTNVNFVSPLENGIRVRTYEKGVEAETFACGTGIVASAIASYYKGICPTAKYQDRVKYDVRALRDNLSVDFVVSDDYIAQDVWLTGPATFVAEILYDC